MRDAVFRHCPKGDVLLPLQWCLVGNLIARLSGGGINIQGYVDGICLLAVGKFPNSVMAIAVGPLYCTDMVQRGWAVG